ncbi:MAG: lasso peptide biosynthesis B2 protein [Actinomycetota bacterium]
MSTRLAITARDRLPLRRRVTPLLAVGAARLLAHFPPRRIRAVLGLLRTGAAAATYARAKAARDAVVAVSVLCAGESCLQRSLAVVLLCRMRGVWPTWCTGIRTAPFCAHAWVEADGQPVGEAHPAGYFRPIIVVPPVAG